MIDKENIKNVHQGHRQRMKEKYIQDGNFDRFEDHEILEILLYYCYPQINTNDKAHHMISCFGSLHNLFEAHPLEISKKCNVTENVAVLVSMIPHLSKRYFSSKYSDKITMDSSTIAGEYCINLYTGLNYENFFLLSLDSHKRLIGAELIHKGTINSAPIYPRLIVESALRHNAASVILSHNHPSGTLLASPSDIEVTRMLMKALEAIDIDVVDHIIVGLGEYYSFAEKRLLYLTYNSV